MPAAVDRWPVGSLGTSTHVAAVAVECNHNPRGNKKTLEHSKLWGGLGRSSHIVPLAGLGVSCSSHGLCYHHFLCE